MGGERRQKITTDKAVKALQPRERQFEVADSQVPGLSLRVLPNGVKTWAFRYRVGSRLRRIALGLLDDLSLKDAREKAQEHRRAIRKDGADPSKEKRVQRETKADTFEALCERYIERHAKPKKRSWKVDQTLIARQLPKSWKLRAPGEITRREIREFLEHKATTAPTQANRIRALLHKLFNFALKAEVVHVNPVSGVDKPAPENSRDRVLSEDEIRAFWSATEGMDAPMRALLRLQLVTAQRVGEVRNLRWTDLDLEGGWWTIPAGDSKNKLSHRVPLSPLALEILDGLPRIEGEPFVLMGARGNRQYYEATAALGIERFVGHDLRRTAASMMASLGISREQIDAVLNHKVHGVVAVYVRHSYDAEKRMALEAWERKLRAIVSGESATKVLSYRRGG